MGEYAYLLSFLTPWRDAQGSRADCLLCALEPGRCRVILGHMSAPRALWDQYRPRFDDLAPEQLLFHLARSEEGIHAKYWFRSIERPGYIPTSHYRAVIPEMICRLCGLRVQHLNDAAAASHMKRHLREGLVRRGHCSYVAFLFPSL